MPKQRLAWFTFAMTTALGLVLAVNCGSQKNQSPDDIADGGPVRSGPDGGTDGGPTDGGGPDGGTDGGTLSFPDAAGWQFYGPQQGGPNEVLGVTSDPSGNIWVAGGDEGLFLLKPGSPTLHRYTMADGLRPYGYLPDGGTPVGDKYTRVISVAGGPMNSVFVGYEGKPSSPHDCEANLYYDEPGWDPNIFKSGDADRVTLEAGDRISVVHYDIFTGPGQGLADEVIHGGINYGREKLCTILRIAYHAPTHSVWFGANHGFAWGDSAYVRDPNCYGQYRCSGVIEHSHPAINAYADESRTTVILLTGEYHGMSVDPAGDVWVGGAARSAHFRYATLGGNFFAAGDEIECDTCARNRLDIWPDRVAEPIYPTPSERVDDNVSDMAAMPDGSVWISSFTQGLAHYTPGRPTEYRQDTVVDPRGYVDSLERDPQDGSLWIGYNYGGLARLKINNGYIPYDYRALGLDLTQGQILDIQSDNYGGHRRILVAFRGGGGHPGAIGVYTGD